MYVLIVIIVGIIIDAVGPNLILLMVPLVPVVAVISFIWALVFGKNLL
jgi:hypothetical protein